MATAPGPMSETPLETLTEIRDRSPVVERKYCTEQKRTNITLFSYGSL